MHGQLAADDQAFPKVRRPFRDERPTYERGDVETSVLLRILWNRRKWIMLCIATLVALTAIYCLLTPSLYTAAAQIIVDPRDLQVVSNAVNPSTVAPDGGVAQVESQVSVVQSNEVLLRAIATTHLEADPEFNGNGFFSQILRLPSLFSSPATPANIEDDLKAKTLEALRKAVSVKRGDKVLVLDVYATSRDADKSARIVNAVAEAYLADQAQARADAGRQASEALAARLAELQGHVKEAENAVEDYRGEHNLVVSTGQLVSDQELNALTAQLSAAQSRTATLKAQLDQLKIANAAGADTPEALNSAVITQLRARESGIVQKLANMSNQLGPLHPDYLAAQAELKHVQSLISAEVDRLRTATRADYARAQADEIALSSKLDQLKSQSLDDDKADVRLRELQREVEAARSVYSSFLVRAKETGEEASVDSTNARIITHALRPQQRTWPPAALLLLGAAFAGLGLGASASLAHEFMAPLVMSAAQAQAIAQAPVIGIMPTEAAPSRLLPNFLVRKAVPGAPDKPGRQDVDAISNRVIQLLLTRLMEWEPRGGRGASARKLIVTSTDADAEERFRAAERIAAVAARNGDNVLLVDADVADGKQGDSSGFLDLLRGDCKVDAVARASATGDYWRIGKGLSSSRSGPRGRPDETSGKFAWARQFFDLIIFDVGALSTNYSAASLVSDADEIVFVAERSKTPQSAVLAEAEVAALMGSPLTSVVLVDKSLRG